MEYRPDQVFCKRSENVVFGEPSWEMKQPDA